MFCRFHISDNSFGPCAFIQYFKKLSSSTGNLNSPIKFHFKRRPRNCQMLPKEQVVYLLIGTLLIGINLVR